MSQDALNEEQFKAVTGRGKGHVFVPQSPGSKWCAVCGHHASVTRHPEAER